MPTFLATALLAFVASGVSPEDSTALEQARRSLETGDTLAAIDLLDERASHRESGREIRNLLGILQFPDEPLESVEPDSGSTPAPLTKALDRKWRLRTDADLALADPWYWNVGATLSARVTDLSLWGRPALLEAGLIGLLWSIRTEAPDGALEPLASLSLQAGDWDLRFDGWSGYFDRKWDAGGMASAVSVRPDSARSGFRWGGSVRWSLLSSRFVGIFGQWSGTQGQWLWDGRSDLRLRQDAVEDTIQRLKSIDIRTARLQATGRVAALRRSGSWAVGPCADLDLRTSFGSDKWIDNLGVTHREVRKDLSWSAGLVGRYTLRAGRWMELRTGWMGAYMDSGIDRTFSDRNSGLLVSLASGWSF